MSSWRAAGQVGAGGAVPLAFPVIESYPRAAHWTAWTYDPGLNPTAGLAGLLYQLGVDHPWRAAATAYCWQQLEAGGLPGDADALKEILVFLEHVPDRDRADQHAAALASNLSGIPLFHLDPDAPGYGLSPLDVAPQASSRWRAEFAALDDEQLTVAVDVAAAQAACLAAAQPQPIAQGEDGVVDGAAAGQRDPGGAQPTQGRDRPGQRLP